MLAEEYIRAARASTGLHHFHSDSFREGLELLADGFHHSPLLTRRGRDLLDSWMINGLRARLMIDDWIDRHGQVLERPVDRPVFIVGLPRTGSSAMQCVLAVDRRLRLLWRWGVDDPTPPAETQHFHDDPRLLAKRRAWEEYHAAGMVGSHAELPEDPTECTTLMQQDFKSLTYEHAIDNPAYRDWLLNGTDMTTAFANHKRNLQVLQSKAPGRWVLKFPPHTLSMAEICQIYPDARFVVLHRDPLVATSSYCELNDFYRWMVTERRDPQAVAAQIFPQLLEHTRRLMAFRDAHPGVPVIDIYYDDFRRDPINALQPLYDFMGLTFPQDLQHAMRDYLADRAKRPFGKHSYTLEATGITRNQALDAFSDYIQRYNIPLEPRK